MEESAWIAVKMLAIIGIVYWLYRRFKTKREEREWDDFESEYERRHPTNERKSKTEGDRNMEQKSSEMNMEGMAPEVCENHNRIVDALRKLGCQPDNGENGDVIVKYQGETFLLRPNGAYFVDIIDIYWSRIGADDADLPLLREAINDVHSLIPSKIILSNPDEDNEILLSTLYTIWLHPDCSENIGYLEGSLRHFFRVKETLHETFNRRKALRQSVN